MVWLVLPRAIGVHPVVGYNDLFHLAPAILGAVLFIVGLILFYRRMHEDLRVDRLLTHEVVAE